MEVVHKMSGILSIMEDIRKTTENIFLNCIYHNTKIKQAGQDRLPSVSHILRTKKCNGNHLSQSRKMYVIVIILLSETITKQ